MNPISLKLTLKTLSPVHIGSGYDISPIEYFFDPLQNRFHRINMDALFQDPDFKPHLNQFLREAASSRYIGRIIPDNLLRSHILYTLPVSVKAANYLRHSQTAVKEHIKSAGRPFIPGSSLKGALLSALLYHQLTEEWKTDNRAEIQEWLSTNRSDQRKLGDNWNKLCDFAFARWSNAGGSGRFKHWIDVSDSDLKAASDALQIVCAAVEGARSSRTLSILYEALRQDLSFSITLSFDPRFIYSPPQFLHIVHSFYQEVASADKAVPKPAAPQGAFLARIGQGSSAFATSLLLFAQKAGISTYPVKPPRTRKRADGNPLGWIALIPDRPLP
jgi:CRISPR type III-A-associated RAMP protein Csm5